MKERLHTDKKILFIGLAVIFICVVALLGIFAHSLGGRGEPANLKTASRVTQNFLETIHTGDVELAHSMLSEKFRPPVSVQQFAVLLHQDENIFSTYNRWEICDWGLFINDGYVIDTSGLLYYDSKKIVVQISLHKDSDSVWRIQGFRFRPNITPTPFGLCN
jgi:hypothetical protein